MSSVQEEHQREKSIQHSESNKLKTSLEDLQVHLKSKEPEIQKLSFLENELEQKDLHIIDITDNILKFKNENEEIKS